MINDLNFLQLNYSKCAHFYIYLNSFVFNSQSCDFPLTMSKSKWLLIMLLLNNILEVFLATSGKIVTRLNQYQHTFLFTRCSRF